MNKTILRAALCALLAGPAFAAGHDAQLEQWIKAHVAAKIGDIRGGFKGDDAPEMVTAETLERAKSAPGLGFQRLDPVRTGGIRAK